MVRSPVDPRGPSTRNGRVAGLAPR